MVRRSGLGKGLGALIPAEATGERESALRDIPLANIRPNRLQPRSHFDEESLAELAASVREMGVLQPVLVREIGTEDFELIAGERRWRAARRAGLQSVPALVHSATEVTSLEQALVENLHRADLNALEEAAAYQQLVEDFGLTHEEVAKRVGKSRVAVTNTLRLLQLPAGVQRLVQDGQLSAGHARALLGTPDRGFQEMLARRAINEGMTVRSVEESVKERSEGRQAPQPSRERRADLRPPGLLELEEMLSTHLDTRVKVEMGSKHGRLVVDFATLEDLERIYGAMTGRPTGST